MFIGSTAPLDANEEFVSDPAPTDRADYIAGAVFSDKAGTLYIEQSADGTNWDISEEVSVSAGDGQGFKKDLLLPLVRVRYANGGTAQTAFRLSTRFSSAGAR